MFSLIKLIVVLILLTGIAVYGGDIWNTIKDKISQFTNPELQRANIFESFKSKFGEVENIVKEINKNIDNPDFDKKMKLNEALGIIKESKDSFQKIEDSDETLIEKTFEGLRDLKEGTQSFFSDSKNSQCEIK